MRVAKSDESDSSVGQSILYGSSSDPEEQKALKAYRKQAGQVLSPRTKLLQAGMFPPHASKNSSSQNFNHHEDHFSMNLEDVDFTLQDIDKTNDNPQKIIPRKD